MTAGNYQKRGFGYGFQLTDSRSRLYKTRVSKSRIPRCGGSVFSSRLFSLPRCIRRTLKLCTSLPRGLSARRKGSRTVKGEEIEIASIICRATTACAFPLSISLDPSRVRDRSYFDDSIVCPCWENEHEGMIESNRANREELAVRKFRPDMYHRCKNVGVAVVRRGGYYTRPGELVFLSGRKNGIAFNRLAVGE